MERLQRGLDKLGEGARSERVAEGEPVVLKTPICHSESEEIPVPPQNGDVKIVNGFHQFGYDGEDFISLDLKTQTWIPLVPQAVISKEQWDKNKAWLDQQKHYLTQECPEWLKKFLEFGRSSLMRKGKMFGVCLSKTPSSPLTCHATGFYPDRADLFWKKDEEELHEDVVKGEMLPNHDGSFQMSVDLDLSGLKDEDWGRYSCVFHLNPKCISPDWEWALQCG
uniref:Ig-like domain-containing protein n=1 Tax=Salarias fasciatus TaxID=181472 RepID=A0A672FFW0_SALFA